MQPDKEERSMIYVYFSSLNYLYITANYGANTMVQNDGKKRKTIEQIQNDKETIVNRK